MAIISQVVGMFEQQNFANRRRAAADDPPQVMLMLGSFEFSVDTAAYSQLIREASWRWSAQERIGEQALLQYTGKDPRSVKLTGETHALFRKGLTALDDLFILADKAEPQQLVSGFGDVLGWWVITEYSDTTTSFLPGGVPRHKSFNLTLKNYADELSNP
ncbi:phage tail protein [Rouxiella sp. T17]|uniref:phage tail protein n=1 Tax=Rouxiella sp. T17 TaxID=3085684 RepID=UPI002FC8EC27